MVIKAPALSLPELLAVALVGVGLRVRPGGKLPVSDIADPRA
jgi:hypothetical protein